jgi:hypothetical protein
MTSKTDKNIGGVVDLTDRLTKILEDINDKKITIPNEPSTLSTASIMSKFEDIGYKTCSIYQEVVGKQIGDVVPVLTERMKLYTKEYAPRILPAFDQLREIIWPEELTEDEKRCKPGVRIEWTEENEKFTMETIGILWDDDELNYFLLFYDVSRPKPKTMDDSIEHAYFKDIEAKNGKPGSISIFKFDGFKILD